MQDDLSEMPKEFNIAGLVNIDITIGKPIRKWESHGKTIGKPTGKWESHGKTIGKPMGKWENHKKPIGQWENHRKTTGTIGGLPLDMLTIFPGEIH